ncbi:hypothetical protein GCM10010530_57880 [Kribbella aluminosa]
MFSASSPLCGASSSAGPTQAQHYAYPRIAPAAKAGWTPQNPRNYADLTGRLAKHRSIGA